MTDETERLKEKKGMDLDETVVSVARTIEASPYRVAALVVVSGPEIGRLYPLRRKRVVLGRGESADVLLKTREVSREHARIEILRLGDETSYRIRDLGSTNHVFVNGQQVEHQILRDDDKIHLGDVVLKFEVLDPIDTKFHEEIRNRIRYDELTGLLTLGFFRTALAWELERRANTAKGCAVIMMDLDDFKQTNDTYGHLAGSFVLQEVGGIIDKNFRAFDVAARYGGEEFVAFLPETDAGEALTAAERVRKLIELRTFAHDGRAIRITISMGISHFPDDGTDLESLIKIADERLYRAKREGKNRISTS